MVPQDGKVMEYMPGANAASGGPPRYDVLGVGISIVTPDQAVATLLDWARDDQGRFVCIRDAHGVMLARRDPDFAAIHREAAMVTPDGMPIALLGRWRGLPVERTCGPDLMLATMRVSPAHGIRHYLHGGQDGVAAEVARRMKRLCPGLSIVGEETPPFHVPGDEELRELAARIVASGAHIVWIGLSTPKQERLMRRLAPLVGATLIGVGAAYDVHAGAIARAPGWMQRLCLEGVYRFCREPRRLWRRYLVLAPQFLARAIVQQCILGWRSRRG